MSDKEIPYAGFEALVGGCAEPMALMDESGRVVLGNPAWRDLWSGADGPKTEVADLARALAAGDDRRAATRFRADTTDRAPRWLSVSLSKVDPSQPLLLAHAEEITGQVLTQRKLDMASMVIEETNRVGVVMDRRGRAVFVNRAFTDIFGHAREAVLGRNPMDLVSGPCTDRSQCARTRARAEKTGRASG